VHRRSTRFEMKVDGWTDLHSKKISVVDHAQVDQPVGGFFAPGGQRAGGSRLLNTSRPPVAQLGEVLALIGNSFRTAPQRIRTVLGPSKAIGKRNRVVLPRSSIL